MIIFTYMETPTSPLSSYVHLILLCRLPPPSTRLVCGFVDAGTYELRVHHHHQTQQHTSTGNAMKAAFFNLGQLCSIPITLLAVWDSMFVFFFVV